MRRTWAAVALGVSALLGPAPGSASADPPPDDPAPAPATGPAVPFLVPAGQGMGENPITAITEYLTQAPGPTAESATAPAGAVPAADPLASVGSLMPQVFGMPTGDQPSPYALSPNVASGFARIDAYQGVHALLHSGLGRMPGDQLGQPLPGTAPPPGTAVPPGLAQFYPDPAAAIPPSDVPVADPLVPVVNPPAN